MITSPGRARAELARMEADAVHQYSRTVDDFLARCLTTATGALNSSVLVAAADPFAFTNVKKHWYDVVRDLAERRADLTPADVYATLLDSSLPSDIYRDVVTALNTSRTENWSTYQTKRHLSRLLIPKERPGTPATSQEHRDYKAFVRRIARTVATNNFAKQQVAQAEEEGWPYKKWVARHDRHTRAAHLELDGTAVPLGRSFRVQNTLLSHPGDPTAPLHLTANCRCVLIPTTGPSITASATLSGMDTTLLTTMVAATDSPTAPCLPCGEYDTDDAATLDARWSGVVGVEGEMTGDGRLIEHNALEWETPIPLRYVSSDVGAHAGAQVVGRILNITRLEDGRLWAEGDFDLGGEVAREAYRQVDEDLTTGISMDLDNVAFEVRVASEMTGNETAMAEDTDEQGRTVVQKISPDDEVRVTTSGRMRAATIVSIPAFSSAKISTESTDEPSDETLDALAEHLSGDTETDPAPYSTEEFKNWVEKTGGLPRYIKRISKHLQRKGMTQSHAIAVAVNAVKRMCATGDLNFPGKQSVNPLSRAQACKAVAEWEAKKAASKVTADDSGEAFRDVSEKDHPDGYAHRSIEDIVADLPLDDTQREQVEQAEQEDLPAILDGIASNTEDEKVKGALMEAAGTIREMLDPALTASLSDKRPPREWFRDPGLTGPSGITVTDEGRVYGHLATWDTCHLSHTGKCVQPPHSSTGYAYFHTGSLVPRTGEEISVGRLTLGTGHAKDDLGPAETMAHYDSTGTIAAYVRVGEDAHGIWVAGVTRPGLSEEKRMELRASPLSGDWRRVGTSLELVAALAVNVAGFPIPRPKGMVASGHLTSLVAAGLLAPTEPITETLSDEDVAYLKRMARRAQEQDAQTARDLRTRVTLADLRRRRLAHTKEQ